MFVFLQAEDGIRDLVRSRGLGDVYKRQAVDISGEGDGGVTQPLAHRLEALPGLNAQRGAVAVSYTHLTLPTSDLV